MNILRKKNFVFFFLFFLVLFLNKGLSRVIVTFTCLQNEVQAAVDSAVDGDIIRLPAGTCTWTLPVKIGTIVSWGPTVISSPAITFSGSGMDKTILINEVPTSEGGMLQVLTEENKSYRITGMQFRGGLVNGDGPDGAISIGGSSHSFRIDHIKFYHLRCRGVRTSGFLFGVIDHCHFNTMTNYVCIDHAGWDHLDFGDGSWNSSLNLGSGEAIFIEDNYMTLDNSNDRVDGVVDCYAGGRFVIRNNIIENQGLGNHGTDSSGRRRSCFSYEIYNNKFTMTLSENLWTVFHSRGGTGVMYNNEISAGYNSLAVMASYRDYRDFSPFGTCDGTNKWDVNDGITYESGVHTGGNNEDVLASSGKSWTVDEWVGFSLVNLDLSNRSSIIESNTANTITIIPDHYPSPTSPVFNTGNRFIILKAYPCIDQIGRSTGMLLSETDPIPQMFPLQSHEPLYFWNNKIDGVDANINSIGSNSPRIVTNRDYIYAERPSYTPYIYPHPLNVIPTLSVFEIIIVTFISLFFVLVIVGMVALICIVGFVSFSFKKSGNKEKESVKIEKDNDSES